MMKNDTAVNQNSCENAPLKPLALSPKMHSLINRFLQQEKSVFDLVEAFGSPINLIFPEIIEENIASFERVYQKHHLSGQIYFTTKPNKSLSIVKQASLQKAGVDVSSEEALKIALSCGFHPERIECTGPKNIAYLTLALQQNVKINIDNFDELNQILELRKVLALKEKTRIFIRLCGFSSPRLKFTAQDGTFGIHIDKSEDIFSLLLAHRDEFDFMGFSFHFNAQSAEQKLIAIANTLQLTLEALRRGLSPKGINIGGGFDICYAESKQQWLDYTNTLKESLKNYEGSLTWNNNGLGYRNEGGLVKGAPNFMAHYIDRAGADDFDYYMNAPLPEFDNMTVAQVLKDCLLELYIEPGRSLLDQVGITIGRVNFIKDSVHGETLIGLDMNRHNIHSTHQKLLTDPVILYQNKENRQINTKGVYYIGNLCLAYDMITYNKTLPDYLPAQGDLVVFINTAPYIMDFVESSTLHQKIASKVSIIEKDGSFKWFKDENYYPVLFKGEKK